VFKALQVPLLHFCKFLTVVYYVKYYVLVGINLLSDVLKLRKLIKKQDRPSTYNVTLRRFRVTILQWFHNSAFCGYCYFARRCQLYENILSHKYAFMVNLCRRQQYKLYQQFIGALAKLRKATISVAISVRPSAWKNSVPTGRIFLKFDVWVFFENLSRKSKFH
jgi:hypothetical protein